MKDKQYKNQLHEVYSALCTAEGTVEEVYGDVDDIWRHCHDTSDRFDAHRYFLNDLLDRIQTLTNKKEFDIFK